MRNTQNAALTSRRSMLTLVAVPALLVGLVACSSPEHAPSGRDDRSSMSEADKKAAAHEFDLAVAKCLRGKGVNQPDPVEDGPNMAIEAGDDLDIEAVGEASLACNESVTADLGERPTTAAEETLNKENDAMNKKQNACLQEKGYDLDGASGGDGGGGTTTGVNPANSGIPPEVLEACGLVGGSSTDADR